MRAVVTRVSEASVSSGGRELGKINRGFLVLLGIGPSDGEAEAQLLADRICGCRVFSDEKGKMNLNLASAGGELLIVSQFTLYADLSSRRPGFTGAAAPELAEPLYERFIEICREKGFHTEHGEFGADMQVASVNDGPVTLVFDTDRGKA
ncbi:MAG: D-aminoacyl-tRNA deacylase [Oscillospiraceae bacterium]|jgi:D-tyrosyl-tRNA(Tyr) deacylase